MASRKQREQEKLEAQALDDFVEAVLRGATITEADLRKLVDLKVREGQRIEYKSEGWTDKAQDKDRPTGKGKPQALQARVAKYMAGFANGTGGVLVIGVAEGKDGTRDNGKPERPDPIPDDRRDTVAEQVKQGLLKLKGQLPRIEPAQYVPATDGGFYVVVGVQRASRLVQVPEPDHLMFYLRVHDTTTYAPDYLAADLFLGRRQQPVSRAVSASASCRRLANSPSDLRPRVTFENVGLAWMEHPRAGFVGIHMGKDCGPLSPSLASEVRVFGIHYGSKDRGPLLYRALTRMDSSLEGRVPPMEGFHVETANRLPAPHLDRLVVLWAFALYLVCLNQEPEWYQVFVLTSPSTDPDARVIPCPDRKPVVAYHVRDRDRSWHPPITWARWEDRPEFVGLHLDGLVVLDEPEGEREPDQGGGADA